MRNKNRGITLIALVIAIIILILLLGVTIASLNGELGFLKKTKDITNKAEIAALKDEIGIAYSTVMAYSKNGRIANGLEEKLDTYVDEYEDEYVFLYKGYEVTVKKLDGEIILGDPNQNEKKTNMKWIYEEDKNGDIVITGIDLSEEEYEIYLVSQGYGYVEKAKIVISEEKIYIPSQIDGKKVVALSMNSELIVPNEVKELEIKIIGVTSFYVPNTIKTITSNSFDYFDYSARNLDFEDGKNKELSIPSSKWNTSSITVRGETYNTTGTSAKNDYGIKWIYETNISGGITITGFDFSSMIGYCDMTSETYLEDGKVGIYVGTDVLEIPSEIDGYKVDSLQLNYEVVTKGWSKWRTDYIFKDVTDIIIPDTVKNISTYSFENFEQDKLTLNFKYGKNEELKIPKNKWYANRIMIEKVEYNSEN